MSFEPITYRYNPPATLAAVPEGQNTTPISVTGGQPTGSSSSSNAQDLIARLADLRDTADYLINIVSLRSANIVVDLDASVDVNVVMALGRIYGTSNPPSGVSLTMYNYILDAEVGMMRSDLAVKPESSPVIPSPLQRADLHLVTSTFEQALVKSGTFDNQLPTLLRQLKTDQVAFDSLTASLRTYPAASPARVTTLPVEQAAVNSPSNSNPLQGDPGNPMDVNPELTSIIQDGTDTWSKYYAATYDLTAGVNSLYSDVSDIVTHFVTQPAETISAAIGVIKALVALFHKNQLATAQKGLIWLVYPMLLSEIGGLAMTVDRLVQKAVSPVFGLVNSLGTLFGQIARSGEASGYILGGGLTGSIQGRVSGSTAPVNEKVASVLRSAPQALATLSASLGWGVNELNSKQDFLQKSLAKVMDRRLNGTGDRLEVMGSLQTMEAMLDIMQSVSSQASANAKSGASSIAGTPAGANLGQAYTASSLSLQGGTNILTPPNLPTPPTNVQNLLSKHGSQQIARISNAAVSGT